MSMKKMEEPVLIVGAGPSGLAMSACLNHFSIPNIVLEKENCSASLWRSRAYDRLKLHLAKEFCNLPYMPFPPNTQTYVPKEEFVGYMDSYVSRFNVKPKYCRSVEVASYNKSTNNWQLIVRNSQSNENELYVAKFLIIASGENSEGLIPKIPGIDEFEGEVLHSNQYKSGYVFHGKKVLVVGCGNSGMEIAYDLSNYGAFTSIVIRSPFHVLTKGMVRLGMHLLKHLPCGMVDFLMMVLAKMWYGDLSKHGIHRPGEGPFYLKAATGRSPVLDVGTVNRIKHGEIKVLPAISRIEKSMVEFENGDMQWFDAIVFATGYKTTIATWLKDYDYILNSDGMPKFKFPNHWKGLNGIYCVGLSQRGLAGISMDALAVADDIKKIVTEHGE